MLYAGSTDGVYRITGIADGASVATDRVLASGSVYRLASVAFDGRRGLLAAGESGLVHSWNGREWTELPVPRDAVYAVAVSPSGGRLYAGTRPSGCFVADVDSSLPTDAADWDPVAGFRRLAEREDWGIPRHDGISQVRSLETHPDAPNRLIAGVEVGGVHVSEDGGETWTARRIDGFDAPHTDDVHHLAPADAETIVASTGSGLFRSTDVGRTWTRLDTGVSQRYARESIVHEGAVYAGLAPSSSTSWNEDDGHGLFVARDGSDSLEPIDAPAADEVVVGWGVVDGDLLAATHQGTLLARRAGDWSIAGQLPTPDAALARYLPLADHPA
ncbi:glycosyl hydrolase [Halovivax limisalsi]|uniref:glycosyl hydrolase n=1 Tax=Halovivax limisalsi TaxID=1453760 RepID=UPI001FFCE7AD|nr:glycosyl hydrolase [Halovivax limisalsi]